MKRNHPNTVMNTMFCVSPRFLLIFPMFEAKELGIEDVKSVPKDVLLESRDQDKRRRMRSRLADGKHLHCGDPQGLIIEHVCEELTY